MRMAGAKLAPVPVDREGLAVAEGIRRARSAHAVYITPSHQYPLGETMTATRRMLLLHWAKRTGAWIIEYDYDSEYTVGGLPIASLHASGYGRARELLRYIRHSDVSRFTPRL